MKKSKVAIIGTSSHRRLAPFDDDSFEIWGINDTYNSNDVTRWDRWFQLHNRKFYDGGIDRARFKEMCAEYAKWDCPVYLVEKHKNIPQSIVFPFMKLVEKYGDYFNNTISWLIAFAIDEGFEEIHIYGVDMAQNTEYGGQRPSCEYFIGLARGMGIKVVLPKQSGLLKAKFLYGIEAEREDVERRDLLQRKEYVMKQQNEVEQVIMRSEQIIREASAKRNACQGAIVTIDELLSAL
jgi:hypothetical protein